MKKLFISLAILLINITLLVGQSKLDIQVDVVYLSSDLLKGRDTGSEGEQMAANYIIKRFHEAGLIPGAENGSWVQNFTFKERLNPHAAPNPHAEARQINGQNVVGMIDNGASFTVVIGGHYDHLGMGHSGSLFAGEKPMIHNGADDNASGIAALIYLAEKLKKSGTRKYNYLFVAFSGEEYGLFGSKHFIKNPSVDKDQMSFMINMDMVGRLNEENTLVINGAGTSPVWKEVFEKIKGDLNLVTTDSGIGASDHTSFYLEDIPALHFFTGQHADYHKPSDDAELVNYDGIVDVSEFIYDLIQSITPEEKLAFSKTNDSGERKASKFKVSLGVMPDYTYSANGMRVDGVLDGRAAQKAGLEKGDIIVELGGKEVGDIYDYMEALSQFKSGDSTKVKVKRDQKELSFEVKF